MIIEITEVQDSNGNVYNKLDIVKYIESLQIQSIKHNDNDLIVECPYCHQDTLRVFKDMKSGYCSNCDKLFKNI